MPPTPDRNPFFLPHDPLAEKLWHDDLADDRQAFLIGAAYASVFWFVALVLIGLLLMKL